MRLTESNYYSQESNQSFWSVSQYKSFMHCEASAMAELNGEYQPPITKAMLVGSFVDAYVEGTLDDFIKSHPEIFTARKQLRAEFRQANEIIKRIQADENFNKFLSGEKQKILTAELFGVPWKIKMDSFSEGICITDLKVVAKTDYLPNWRYDLQGAAYQAVTEANGYGRLPFYLATITKERIADMNVFQIEQAQLDLAYREIEENMTHLIEVKGRMIEPKRCEKCPYCRMTRKIYVRGYSELMEG